MARTTGSSPLRSGANDPALKRMRNKLLTINLISLTLVIAIAFSVIYLNFYNRTQGDIAKTLSSIPRGVIENVMLSHQSESVLSGGTSSAGGRYITISGDPRIPVDYSKSFVANVMSDGSVAVFSMLDMDDETFLGAIETVLTRGAAIGDVNIAGRTWRYSIEHYVGNYAPYAYSIVFIDVEDTNLGLRALAASLFVIGVVAVGVILLISLLVANRAIRPVEESIIKQRRFVADASHELKTPIAVIAANAEAAGNAAREAFGAGAVGAPAVSMGAPAAGAQGAGAVGNVPEWTDRVDEDKASNTRHPDAEASPQLFRWIGNIADEANRMNDLVENLLALAKAEEKKAESAQFDLVGAICEESDRVEAFLFEKGIAFEFELYAPKNEPLIVCSDRAKVQAILSVLLENAVKYTPDGGRVTVTAGKTNRSGPANPLQRPFVSVSNTGAYIPPEDLAHIFDRFYRADPSRNSETGGHGIGLSIANEISSSIAASLTAISVPHVDGNATNTFTLAL